LPQAVSALWTGSPPEIEAALQDLLEEARARPLQPLSGREARVEMAFAALFVLLGAALLALLPSPRPLALPDAVALTALYAIASRVEFATGAGSTVPTQLAFVPMLFVLPTPAVPLFVAAGLLLGRLPRYLSGRTPPNRAVVELGDALYSVCPVVVLALAGADTPSFSDWPVYLLALAAQFLSDTAFSTARSWLGLGVPPTLAIRELVWICVVDGLLACVGLLAALAATAQPYGYLLLLPLLGMLTVAARDRDLRIRQSVELYQAYRGSALLLDRVVASDDRLTGEHGRGVVDLALRVGAELGLTAQECVELEFAALLHDVGKVAIDNEIINKRGPLTQEEFTVIKTHTIEGHRMLAAVGGLLGRVGVIVRSCHERWDGSGYPDGLAGEAIPLAARIVFCADAFHAMTTDRSYRTARSPERALAELEAHAGSQFDPTVVEALVLALRDDGAEAARAAPLVPRPGRARRARQLRAWHSEPPPVSSDQGLLGLVSDGTVHSMNSAAVRLLGWSPEEAIGRPLHDLVQHSYPNGRPYPRDASAIEAALRGGMDLTGAVEVFWRKDGGALGVRYSIRQVTEQGRMTGASLRFKPLVARSPAEEALRLGEELYRSLARNLHNSTVMLFDQELRLLVAEGQPLAPSDLEHEALTGRKLQDVLPAAAWARLREPASAALEGERREFEFASHDGRFYRMTVGPVRDDQGAVQAGLAVAEDITQRRDEAQRLDRLAHRDELTGLMNRAAFHELADKALRRASRSSVKSALLFLDLDGLKAVNDARGHEAGDELLRAVASRLAESVREADTVARLGGDEFALLLDAASEEAEVAAAADRVIAAVSEPLRIDDDQPIVVTASVGIAIQSRAGESGADLLKAADAAMYRAKGLGGNRFQFFNAASDRRAAAWLEAGRALARAIERDELTVHYQPEVDLATGSVVAVEALVRWRHPERGLLLPAAFMSQAERQGLAESVDDWVVRRACRQAIAWSDDGLPPFRIAVNLSSVHVRRSRLDEIVRRRLDESGLPAERLELEVTEDLLEQGDEPAEEMLRRLQAHGARIVIDRFGRARSQIERLRTFPVDALKIDGSFVRELPGESRMTVSLIGLAHAFGLEAIAGCVETPEQVSVLRVHGCDRAVGHAFSVPTPAERLTPWLVSNARLGEK
jgi:diguanylate cyclase (GGDEF)-like protein/PAS domain S-box-containing protein